MFDHGSNKTIIREQMRQLENVPDNLAHCKVSPQLSLDELQKEIESIESSEKLKDNHQDNTRSSISHRSSFKIQANSIPNVSDSEFAYAVEHITHIDHRLVKI